MNSLLRSRCPLSTLYLDLLSIDSLRMDRLWEAWRGDLHDLVLELFKGGSVLDGGV